MDISVGSQCFLPIDSPVGRESVLVYNCRIGIVPPVIDKPVGYVFGVGVIVGDIDVLGF